jgi:hypothetical protein
MPEKPKISEIARQSGVSLSTVSLVLNNKPGVSQETRTRVLDVAAELAYPLKSPPPPPPLTPALPPSAWSSRSTRTPRPRPTPFIPR